MNNLPTSPVGQTLLSSACDAFRKGNFTDAGTLFASSLLMDKHGHTITATASADEDSLASVIKTLASSIAQEAETLSEELFYTALADVADDDVADDDDSFCSEDIDETVGAADEEDIDDLIEDDLPFDNDLDIADDIAVDNVTVTASSPVTLK